MTLPFHPEAAEELEAATKWYASEDARASARFVAEVKRRLHQAFALPRSGPRVLDVPERFEARAFGLSGFPYVAVTATVRDTRLVVAIAHTSRDPGYCTRLLPDGRDAAR